MDFSDFKGFDLPKFKTDTWLNPVVITYENGDRRVSETTMTYCDDWWDTPLGRINFGKAYLSTRFFVERPTETKHETEGAYMKPEPQEIESLARFLCDLDGLFPDELRSGNMAFHSSFDPEKYWRGEYDNLFDDDQNYAPDGLCRGDPAMFCWRDYVERAVKVRQFLGLPGAEAALEAVNSGEKPLE